MQKTNPSLQKKSAARTAAVQCMYRQAMAGEARIPEVQVKALKAQLANNRDEQKLLLGAAIEPDYAMLGKILEGVEKWREEIDAKIDASLTPGWARARISPVLLALLQCGIFELSFGKDINPRIVIDEYTRLARSFFADAEVGFVHGMLNKLAGERHG